MLTKYNKNKNSSKELAILTQLSSDTEKYQKRTFPHIFGK